MTNPRTIVEFEGIHDEEDFATFPIDGTTITYDATQPNGSAQVDLAVNLTTSDTLQLVGDAEFVLGKLIKVEADGMAVVQHGGFMTLPGGTSATLTRGSGIVGDLLVSAKGYIRSAASGTAAELLLMNGKIIDPSVTTAVVVKL